MDDKLEFHIDPFGQESGLWNLYTQLTFCYAVESNLNRSNIIKVLQQGLVRLAKSFPWIAGQVVKEAYGNGSSRYLIRELYPVPTLVVKDLTDTLPSIDKFRARNFPIDLLDENDVAARNTKSDSDEQDAKPVFLVQASFIVGGLLLTFAGQHGTMDMVGQGEIIKLFSKACHDTPFTEEELTLGNRDRRHVVPLLSDSEIQSTEEGEQQSAEEKASSSGGSDPEEKMEAAVDVVDNLWANFAFSATALRKLKAHAMENISNGTGFVSTDDTLSAFIWQRVTHARLPRWQGSSTSTFARTVDVRRYLDIAPTYPGNLASKTSTTYTFEQLLDEPLGVVASHLRSGIDPTTSDLGYKARATATTLSQSSPNTEPKKRSRDLSRDIAFSSWAKLDYCHDLEFNLDLGKPEAVRRPAFAPPGEQPMEGVIYLLPKLHDGGMVVSICLRSDDMQRLRADNKWMEYAT